MLGCWSTPPLAQLARPRDHHRRKSTWVLCAHADFEARNYLHVGRVTPSSQRREFVSIEKIGIPSVSFESISCHHS